jgi:hypothetical protein
MRYLISTIAVVGALVSTASLAGCTADVHDNTVSIPNASVQMSTSADTSNVHQGESLPVTVSVMNVYLVDPGAQVPSDHTDDAGQLAFFIDDDSGSPILVTAQVNVSVTIPQGESEGHHKLICEVQKHDGTPTNVSFSMDFTVVAGST